jgi:long-chain acyl-CoA synthetase
MSKEFFVEKYEYIRPEIDIPAMPYDHLLRAAAEKYPDRQAIIFNDQILTYSEVVSMVNRVANGLRGLGIGKGERICLFTPNCPEYVITLQAVATIGAVVIPINPAFKEREITYQLLDAEASTILIYHSLVPRLVSVLAQLPSLKHIIIVGSDSVPEEVPDAISYTQLLSQSSSKRPDPADVSVDDVCILVYSSGTTGLPKGIMLSHHNLVANHLQCLACIGLHEVETTIVYLPLSHIYTIAITGNFLAVGATLILTDGFELTKILGLCERYRITWFFATPPILRALADASDLSSLRTVKYLMSSAGALPKLAARTLAERTDMFVVQGYGMTEASPIIHFPPIAPHPIHLDSVGTLVPNTRQKIVDVETGTRELPLGEDGELIISGPQVMLGYWRAPEATAQVVRDGWLFTGDIGHIDVNGFLYLVDRKKEMINRNSYSVSPTELEGILLEHPAVQDAAVVGIPDDLLGESTKGFVVARKGMRVTDGQLLIFVNDQLSHYKKLDLVEFLDAIPKGSSGKTLRRDLKERERMRRG